MDEKKNIVIIGNSSAARETYWLLQEIFETDMCMKKEYVFYAFCGWNNHQGNLKDLASFEITQETLLSQKNEVVLAIAIGNALLRRDVYYYYKNLGFEFINIISQTVYVCPNAIIGEANIFQRFSSVDANAKIGNGNFFNGFVSVAHDAEIEDFNVFGPRTIILGSAKMGSANQVAPNCTFLDKTKVGSENVFAPGTIVYKGCKDKIRMAGNPALKVSDIE